MHAYANSNPIKYIDPNGHWIETVLDIAFIAYDSYDICAGGLNWENGLSLTSDAVVAVIPIASGFGSGVQALFHAGKAVDKVKIANRDDSITDIVSHSDDLLGASRVSKRTSTLFHYTNEKRLNGILDSQKLLPSLSQ